MIGLLKLDTRFPRPVGDAGNPQTWREPLCIETLPGVTVGSVVDQQMRSAEVLERCLCAAQRLSAQGARVITTSCGFLAAFQQLLSQRSRVPVVTSSLCLLPRLQSQGIRLADIGVLTFDAQALNSEIFAALDTDPPEAIVGLPAYSTLVRTIRLDAQELPLGVAREEAVLAARTLHAQRPRLHTLVLECTNLGPFKRAIACATGLRVLDVVDAVHQLAP